jgi:hypothetical protein
LTGVLLTKKSLQIQRIEGSFNFKSGDWTIVDRAVQSP